MDTRGSGVRPGLGCCRGFGEHLEGWGGRKGGALGLAHVCAGVSARCARRGSRVGMLLGHPHPSQAASLCCSFSSLWLRTTRGLLPQRGGWEAVGCRRTVPGANPPLLLHFEPPSPLSFPLGLCVRRCRCIVKITGEMVLSFPAGITRHFANNPAPAVLTFRVLNYNRLEHVLPNPQLLCW